MDHGASSAFCLCEPTGQIVAVCELWSVDDRFLITLPEPSVAGFLKRTVDMVIMEDVEAFDFTSQFCLFSIQGPTATAELGKFLELPSLDGGSATLDGAPVFVLRCNRTGMGGWDVWVPAEATGALKKIRKSFPAIGSAAYEIARLESGIPVFGADYDLKTLPPELGPAFTARHVSYNKGCYTGQEVLMRIHSRGHTNRTWVGLIAEAPIEPGAIVKHSLRADAGKVTSSVFSPDYGHIGAAVLRNEIALDGERVTVETENGEVGAEVRIMPILRFD
jgi:folate-binding protein YgfZ